MPLTLPPPDIIGLDGAQAACHYQALTIAAAAIRDQMRLKSAVPFIAALQAQLAQYEAEKARMAAHFPTLK